MTDIHSDAEPRRGAHQVAGVSVFVKLVAIMLAMAASLLLLVGGFFLTIVSPGLNASMEQFVGEYARTIAQRQPDLREASEVSARLDIGIRFEGDGGTWSTDPRVPTVDWVRSRRSNWSRLASGGGYILVDGARGGTYLFAWDFGERIREAHDNLVILLLVLMAVVVWLAHAIIRRLLRPLQVLGDGVGRLGRGELDLVLPNRRRDEFGILTDAFNDMVRRVGEMMRARDRLLLDVSHELRSPLTRLKVALELLPDDTGRARMSADVGEMEAMIAELLELERLRDGRDVRPLRQDLVPIVRAVASTFDGMLPGVNVVSAPPEALLDIDGDKVRMVLRNLLENAVKYALPDSGPVEIRVASLDHTVTVRVTDDGPGIPDGTAESLFEPFFRVDRSRSRKTGGYGLGLSICKRVMEAHGGSVDVERNVGRGASFLLTFPTSSARRRE